MRHGHASYTNKRARGHIIIMLYAYLILGHHCYHRRRYYDKTERPTAQTTSRRRYDNKDGRDRVDAICPAEKIIYVI